MANHNRSRRQGSVSQNFTSPCRKAPYLPVFSSRLHELLASSFLCLLSSVRGTQTTTFPERFVLVFDRMEVESS